MIAARTGNDYTEITKIFAGGDVQQEIIKVWSTDANDWVYEATDTVTGTLPLTAHADGSDTVDYKIYGDTGGVGEEVDITGLSEPLCGIGTYTDSLDLSTGILTRRIKKLVLTGAETDWRVAGEGSTRLYNHTIGTGISYSSEALCNVAKYSDSITTSSGVAFNVVAYQGSIVIRFHAIEYATLADFKSYLAAQYAAETPVTVWYVLAEPEVSTITVPSGLTGTIEGYLIQDGTPTPESPIYPTANGVKQADDTYSIKYGYKLDMVSRTENLFDWNWLANGYHISPTTGFPEENTNRISILQPIQINSATGAFLSYARVGNDDIKAMYSVLTDDDTLLRRVTNIDTGGYLNLTGGSKLYIAFYDSFSTGIAITKSNVDNIMLNEGSTALPYQPYSNTTTPIYIGDDPLYEDEYVDFSEQKIYRMIDGTLTPTDPPVPLPALPTFDDADTVFDYEETPAPSSAEITFKKGW